MGCGREDECGNVIALFLATAISAAAPSLGQQLYQVHCASCHGQALQGSAQAPPLVNVDAEAVDFELRTGRMPAQVPHVQQFDRAPIFSGAEIDAIAGYVMSRSTGNKSLPAPHIPGNVENGRKVFEENCEQCHSATGGGNSVGYADVAPPLTGVPPQIIADAVRVGPDVMPRFGPKVISDKDLADVITYIRYLHAASDNFGGLQLGNWGPVSEGFAAWAFGMGLLVLLVRRIGTTE